MPGPGEDRPDPSQGITRIEDLPKPRIRCQSRNYRRRPVHVAATGHRDGGVRRTLHDLGNPLTGRPRELIMIYSLALSAPRCRKYFQCRHHWTWLHPVVTIPNALSTWPSAWSIEDGLPDCAASCSFWRDHRALRFLTPRSQYWLRTGGKGQGGIPTDLPRLGTLRLLRLYRR